MYVCKYIYIFLTRNVVVTVFDPTFINYANSPKFTAENSMCLQIELDHEGAMYSMLLLNPEGEIYSKLKLSAKEEMF